jgi:cutinase
LIACILIVFSQGAQLVHLALGQVPLSVKSHVAAVVRPARKSLQDGVVVWLITQVVFGDPDKGRAILGISRDKIYTNCASSDPICMGIPLPIGSHLGYGTDTAELTKCVQFVTKQVA